MARTTWGPLSTDEQNSIEFAPVGEPGVLVAGTAGGLLKRNADGTIGNSILSESGSVLTAAGRLVITGGTVTASTPVLNLTQTWNLAGTTFTGLKFNVTDSASAIGSLLFDFQVGGSSKASVRKDGLISASALTGTTIYVGSSFDTPLARAGVNSIEQRNGVNPFSYIGYGTADAGLLNYRRIRTTMTTGGAATIAAEGLGTGVSGNTLAFVVNAVTALTFSSAGAATFGGSIVAPNASPIGWSSSGYFVAVSDGVFRMTQASGSGFGRLNFGGDTSSFPSLKRSTTIVQGRLADDSDFCTIQGKIRTDNAYVAVAPGAATGTVTITDSTGTVYRVPVLV